MNDDGYSATWTFGDGGDFRIVDTDDTLDRGIEVPDEPNPGPEPVPDDPPEPVDPQREPVKTDAIPEEAI